MLEGEQVRLTPLRPEDSPLLFKWINDRELVNLSAPFQPVGEDAHRRWFEQIRNRADVEVFAIRLRVDDRLIGSCQLREIAPDEGRCELQIRIGERDAWGRGHGTEAVRLLCRHAFRDLGLRRVELEVFETNRAAIRTYEKAGFRHQGQLPEKAIVDDVPVTVMRMAIEADGGEA